MKKIRTDKDYLLKIRYLYKLRLKNMGLNEINTDFDFDNNYKLDSYKYFI